jgi:Na+(H+)/acetate symporter ActP
MSLIQIAVILFIGLTLVVGIRTYSKIKGRATNYYVAGNAMPVAIVGITLCAQAFDANGSMGNAFLSFSVLPLPDRTVVRQAPAQDAALDPG